MGKRKAFYAVVAPPGVHGARSGIYTSWEDAVANGAQGVRGVRQQGFAARSEAEAFLARNTQADVSSLGADGAAPQETATDAVPCKRPRLSADEGSSTSDPGIENLHQNQGASAYNPSGDASSSVALRMMHGMGYVDGAGLGRDGQGMREPVKESGRLGRDQRGLGFGSAQAPATAPAEGSPSDEAAALDPLQQEAIDAALEGKNLFLTGGPGTGKSFTLRRMIEQLRQKWRNQALAAGVGEDEAPRDETVMVTAPTGVAAILVHGQTMYAKPGPGKPLPTTEMFGNMWGNKKMWRNVRTLVIDEISMVDAEFFEWYFSTLLDIQRGSGDRPIQLIVVGDFFQLPPVGGESAPRTISQAAPDQDATRSDGTPFGSFLEQCMVDANMNWQTPFVPFGFKETKGKLVLQTLAWRRAKLVTVKLQRCFRTDSDVLLAGCSAMREGKNTGPEIDALVRATGRALPKKDGIVPTTLMPTRAEVQRLNDEQLSRLSEELHEYEAEDVATPHKDAGPRAKEELLRDPMFTKEDECPAVKTLKLRIDAQVMLLQNELLSEEEKKSTPASQRLVNGSRGVVIGWEACPDADPSVGAASGAADAPLLGQQVRIEGLQSKPELNGRRGKAERFDVAKGRYEVRLEGEGQVVLVRPTNLSSVAEPTLYPLVRFLNGRVKVIKPEAFEKEIYLLGTCTRKQVPLALAWGLTIHKSQGSSLDYMVADLSKCFADGHAYVAVSRARSLEGLEVRGFSPDKIMTSQYVVDFYRALDAGPAATEEFLAATKMWWAPVVQHPQRIPPIQGASTWKDLYERHPTFKQLQEDCPQGGPLPDLDTWRSRHQAASKRSKDVCFRCNQPGHWARNCPNQRGSQQSPHKQWPQPPTAPAAGRWQPAPLPQHHQPAAAAASPPGAAPLQLAQVRQAVQEAVQPLQQQIQAQQQQIQAQQLQIQALQEQSRQQAMEIQQCHQQLRAR